MNGARMVNHYAKKRKRPEKSAVVRVSMQKETPEERGHGLKSSKRPFYYAAIGNY